MRTVLCLVPLLLIFGCTSMGGSGGRTIDDAAPSIERFTELAATIAFANDRVKNYREPVCDAMVHLAGILDDFGEANATFERLREVALAAIRNIEHPLFTDDVRRITRLAVDQILDVVFIRIRDRYNDLIAKDEAHVVLIVARSISVGLNNACGSSTSISSFNVD